MKKKQKISTINFQIFDDSIQLQKFYIHLRDELCSNGVLFRSPALLFNEERLQQELIREENEISSGFNTKTRNSTKLMESSEKFDHKESVSQRTFILFFVLERKSLISVDKIEHDNRRRFNIEWSNLLRW